MVAAVAGQHKYHHLVPRDVDDNLAWRREVVTSAIDSPQRQQELRIMSARDILFWVNGFVWTYDPRPAVGFYDFKDGRRITFQQSFSDATELPFVTFPKQDECFLAVEECLGRCDIGAEKSRDMGMTWIFLLNVLHKWLFRRRQSFMLGSRVGSEVDDTGGAEGNTDTLFWKLEFALVHLPGWMKPDYERTKMRMYNPETKGIINGATSTGNLGRGGRRTGLFLDELAAWELKEGYEALSSTQSNTPSRLFCSTPKGVGNAFADQMLHTQIRKVRLHWSDHPLKRKGLYTSKNGVLKIVDDSYEFPPDYKFILDGRVRSPFYDAECARSPLDSLVKQEQDIDYLGSGSQFFDIEGLKRHMEHHGREPYETGFLAVDKDPREHTYRQADGGQLLLWCVLEFAEGKYRPQRDRAYVIGADISAGTGASNSVAAVGDLRTKQKVAMLVTPHMRPEEFAVVVAGLGYWFCDHEEAPARVIYESNGPGRQFGDKLVDLGYPALFFRQNEDELGRPVSNKAIPGFHAAKDVNRTVLGHYNEALADETLVDPCQETLKEAEKYIYCPDGSVRSSSASNPMDPSGAGANHGDRVRASAFMWKLIRESGITLKDDGGENSMAPPGSLAHRRWRRSQEKRQREEELCSW